MTETPDSREESIPIRDLLNAQTGRLGWEELARHFARGVVVCVSPGKDLVRAAELMVANQAEELDQWSVQGDIWRANDEDAKRWQETNSDFWAVVVAPWVVVQEVSE